MENPDKKFIYVCAVKQRPRLRMADIIIGPDIDGNYRFDPFNVRFYGIDKEHNAYQFDGFGNAWPVGSAYFDEEDIFEEAKNFRALKARLDRRIRKRLVWEEEEPATPWSPAKMMCVGIR